MNKVIRILLYTQKKFKILILFLISIGRHSLLRDFPLVPPRSSSGITQGLVLNPGTVTTEEKFIQKKTKKNNYKTTHEHTIQKKLRG